MLRRQAFASLQHGFLFHLPLGRNICHYKIITIICGYSICHLASVENVFIYNFVTPNGVWENVFLYNIDTYFYYHCLADVMPYCVIGRCFMPARCYCQEEDVILLVFMVGRCYCHTYCGRCYAILYYVATHCIG